MTRCMIRIYIENKKSLISTYHNCDGNHDTVLEACKSITDGASFLQQCGEILAQFDGREVFNINYMHKVLLETRTLETYDVYNNWDLGTHGFPRTPIKASKF